MHVIINFTFIDLAHRDNTFPSIIGNIITMSSRDAPARRGLTSVEASMKI